MSLLERFWAGFFSLITGAMFRIHDEQIARVPLRGPLIIIANHINIFEVPIMYLVLRPRQVRALALSVRWKNPIFAMLFRINRSIPLDRGGVNLENMRLALEALEHGDMLAIAPEGTRSSDGRLQAGYPGVVLLALRSGAPLLPVVFHGGEKYRENLKKLRRTDFYLEVGQPFRLRPVAGSLDRDTRAELTTAVMSQIAAALPPAYRGVYANVDPALTERWIEYL